MNAANAVTVRRLALEIARTTRQVNALEHVLIPGYAVRPAASRDPRDGDHGIYSRGAGVPHPPIRIGRRDEGILEP